MEALRLIREEACDGLNVQELLDRLDVSPSTLERRFKSGLGRSPKEEIQRVRVERIKKLLTETDHTLPEIAELTGFKTPAQLNVAFKAITGCPPGEFRDREGPRPGRSDASRQLTATRP
jgi:LacI family transcriptional regulator